MTTVKPDWTKALKPQERSKLKELDKRIRLQEEVAELTSGSVRELKELVYLKYQRKVIQNTATIRARRSLETA